MTRWYLGAQNDALYIIDKPPTPNANDCPPWDNPNGPNVIAGPMVDARDDKQLEKVVAAHNAVLDALEFM